MISIATTHEAAEAAANFLCEAGAAGVEIEDPAIINAYRQSGAWDYAALPVPTDTETVIIKAYLPADEAVPEKVATLRRRLAGLKECGLNAGKAAVTWHQIEEEDWAHKWRQYFHPFHVGKRVVVKPSWEKYTPAPEEVVVELDPGLAFGTGTHPSTALCLRLLEKHVFPGAVVLDIGTGSGILAVAAVKLGASRVVAVDNDSLALRAARENVARNGMARQIVVQQSDLLQAVEVMTADIVVANIVADAIIRLAPAVSSYLTRDGLFVASGIITQRLAEVTAAIEGAGLSVTTVEKEGGWAAIAAVRRA